jgi:hypothetical protein
MAHLMEIRMVEKGRKERQRQRKNKGKETAKEE